MMLNGIGDSTSAPFFEVLDPNPWVDFAWFAGGVLLFSFLWPSKKRKLYVDTAGRKYSDKYGKRPL